MDRDERADRGGPADAVTARKLSCLTCRYYEPPKYDYEVGSCHRRAPTFVLKDGARTYCLFPEVDHLTWCGEYEPARPEEVERLREAIAWALGEVGDFRHREPGEGAYWWRTELRRRALSADSERTASPSATPPKDPTS